MKARKTRQLELFPQPKPKRDRLFRRPDSRFWQCRFYAAGQWHRRTTFAVPRDIAKAMMVRWKLQIERRGKPHQERLYADKQCG